MAKTIFKPVSYELSQLLGDIDLGRLALPELQRPFVWQKTAVRDLLDSMYRGFPIGYLMLWNAAETDARLIGANGKQHTPTEFIVDGQQRLTSLYAVMKGAEITFKDFTRSPTSPMSSGPRTSRSQTQHRLLTGRAMPVSSPQGISFTMRCRKIGRRWITRSFSRSAAGSWRR